MNSFNIRARTRAGFPLTLASAVIILITVGCATGNAAPTAPVQVQTTKPGLTAAPVAPVQVPTTAPAATSLPVGPIAQITIASSVDQQGNLVDPRYTFDPAQPQITAIVRAAKLTGANSSLTITWYSLNQDDVAEKLFEHQIAVHNNDLAYSTAKNPGTLAEGTYRITASLEGQTAQTEIDVRSQKTSDAAVTAASAGKSPVSGSSGAIPHAAGKPAAPPAGGIDCGTNLIDDTSMHGIDPSANLIDFFLGGACQDHAVPIQISATLNGETRTITQAAKDYDFRLDPCSFQAGADLPGTKVHFKAVGLYQGQQIPGSVYPDGTDTTLGPDTLAPRLEVHSKPAKGTPVKAGDKIEVDVTATELSTGGPWQWGVHMIQVISTKPGGLVGTPWTNPDRLPKPCGAKTWSKDYQVTYTVPDNPPAVIQLCALTDDYEPNKTSKCADFPTTLTIQGTYDYSWNYDAKGNPWHFAGQSTATFKAQAGEGNSMKGVAQVRWNGTGNGSDPKGQCKWSFSTGDISWSVDLEGTFQKNADGSVSVFLMPKPTPGPLGPPIEGGCPGAQPSRITTAAFTILGTLVNGRADTRQDLPIDGQGLNRLIMHLERVGN